MYIELSSKRIFFHFLQTSHSFQVFPFLFLNELEGYFIRFIHSTCYAAWKIETRGFDWSDALISGAGRGWGGLGEKSDVKGTCEKMTVKISRNWLAIKQGVIRVARVKIHRSIFRPCRLHLANAIPRQSDSVYCFLRQTLLCRTAQRCLFFRFWRADPPFNRSHLFNSATVSQLIAL